MFPFRLFTFVLYFGTCQIYKNSHISSPKPLYDDELESIIEKFFINLFPLAYHHAVHSAQNEGEDVTMRDFHIDYKNCLTHTYEDLQPFGDIPSRISRSLVQSVSAANVLLRALERGTDVLLSTEDLPIDTLSVQCQQALVRMNYCAACKGHNYHHARPCYGYCSNVMRLVCNKIITHKKCMNININKLITP